MTCAEITVHPAHALEVYDNLSQSRFRRRVESRTGLGAESTVIHQTVIDLEATQRGFEARVESCLADLWLGRRRVPETCEPVAQGWYARIALADTQGRPVRNFRAPAPGGDDFLEAAFLAEKHRIGRILWRERFQGGRTASCLEWRQQFRDGRSVW